MPEVGSAITALAVSPDERFLAVGGRDILKTYVIGSDGSLSESRNLRSKQKKGLDMATSDLQWHPTVEHMLASGSTNGVVLTWDISRGRSQSAQDRTFRHTRSVNRVSWHPTQASWLLTASQDGTVRLWDARCSPSDSTLRFLAYRYQSDTRAELDSFPLSEAGHAYHPNAEAVRDVQFDPFSPLTFAAALEDGSVQLWDARNPSGAFDRFPAHAGLVMCLEYHPAVPDLLATGGRDRMVCVWSTGPRSRTFADVVDAASAAASGANGAAGLSADSGWLGSVGLTAAPATSSASSSSSFPGSSPAGKFSGAGTAAGAEYRGVSRVATVQTIASVSRLSWRCSARNRRGLLDSANSLLAAAPPDGMAAGTTKTSSAAVGIGGSSGSASAGGLPTLDDAGHHDDAIYDDHMHMHMHTGHAPSLLPASGCPPRSLANSLSTVHFQLATCSALLDTSCYVWDVRHRFLPVAVFGGHRDVVTGLAWVQKDALAGPAAVTAPSSSSAAAAGAGAGAGAALVSPPSSLPASGAALAAAGAAVGKGSSSSSSGSSSAALSAPLALMDSAGPVDVPLYTSLLPHVPRSAAVLAGAAGALGIPWLVTAGKDGRLLLQDPAAATRPHLSLRTSALALSGREVAWAHQPIDRASFWANDSPQSLWAPLELKALRSQTALGAPMHAPAAAASGSYRGRGGSIIPATPKLGALSTAVPPATPQLGPRGRTSLHGGKTLQSPAATHGATSASASASGAPAPAPASSAVIRVLGSDPRALYPADDGRASAAAAAASAAAAARAAGYGPAAAAAAAAAASAASAASLVCARQIVQALFEPAAHVFALLALTYVAEGADTRTLCLHNASVAAWLGLYETAQVWRTFAALWAPIAVPALPQGFSRLYDDAKARAAAAAAAGLAPSGAAAGRDTDGDGSTLAAAGSLDANTALTGLPADASAAGGVDGLSAAAAALVRSDTAGTSGTSASGASATDASAHASGQAKAGSGSSALGHLRQSSDSSRDGGSDALASRSGGAGALPSPPASRANDDPLTMQAVQPPRHVRAVLEVPLLTPAQHGLAGGVETSAPGFICGLLETLALVNPEAAALYDSVMMMDDALDLGIGMSFDDSDNLMRPRGSGSSGGDGDATTVTLDGSGSRSGTPVNAPAVASAPAHAPAPGLALQHSAATTAASAGKPESATASSGVTAGANGAVPAAVGKEVPGSTAATSAPASAAGVHTAASASSTASSATATAGVGAGAGEVAQATPVAASSAAGNGAIAAAGGSVAAAASAPAVATNSTSTSNAAGAAATAFGTSGSVASAASASAARTAPAPATAISELPQEQQQQPAGPLDGADLPEPPILPPTTVIEAAAAAWDAMRKSVALDVLHHYAEAGDVQMCVTLCRALGPSIEGAVGKRRLQAWHIAYIDLLHRLQLWSPASTVMARASDEGIRRMNQMQTNVAPACASCSRDVIARPPVDIFGPRWAAASRGGAPVGAGGGGGGGGNGGGGGGASSGNGRVGDGVSGSSGADDTDDGCFDDDDDDAGAGAGDDVAASGGATDAEGDAGTGISTRRRRARGAGGAGGGTPLFAVDNGVVVRVRPTKRKAPPPPDREKEREAAAERDNFTPPPGMDAAAVAAGGAGGDSASDPSLPVLEPGSGELQAVAGTYCDKCRDPVATCAVCLQPVKGVFVWCQGCGHGGHLEHLLEWFSRHSSLCPTGCMHVCNLSGCAAAAAAAAAGGGGAGAASGSDASGFGSVGLSAGSGGSAGVIVPVIGLPPRLASGGYGAAAGFAGF